MALDELKPESTRLGWIGTGVMGASMCAHLIDAGYEVCVYSRTRSKAAALLERGAQWVDTPAEVAARSDAVFTMVGYPSDLRSVIFDLEGVHAGARPGAILIDMTTSEPSLAVEMAEAGKTRGIHCLDAPVSGGDVGARNASLSIMVGGPEEVFEAARPCLNFLGSTVVRQGGHGAGQHTKLVNQTLIAGNMVGVCEALVYACRAGLDLEDVLKSVASGAAGSWSLSNLAPRMIEGDMDPGFYVDHFVKDLGMALDEARRSRLSLPGLALAHQLYVSLQAQGRGLDGTQALVHAIAGLSSIDWNGR